MQLEVTAPDRLTNPRAFVLLPGDTLTFRSNGIASAEIDGGDPLEMVAGQFTFTPAAPGTGRIRITEANGSTRFLPFVACDDSWLGRLVFKSGTVTTAASFREKARAIFRNVTLDVSVTLPADGAFPERVSLQAYGAPVVLSDLSQNWHTAGGIRYADMA